MDADKVGLCRNRVSIEIRDYSKHTPIIKSIIIHGIASIRLKKWRGLLSVCEQFSRTIFSQWANRYGGQQGEISNDCTGDHRERFICVRRIGLELDWPK